LLTRHRARIRNPAGVSKEIGNVIMSAITASLIVLACVFGGAIAGIFLRSVLPPHQLSPDTKDVVRLGMGLVGTIVALVLGLLVASAKGSYDEQNNELTQLSANIGLLDRVLAHYGPEAQETRNQLHGAAMGMINRIWPKDHSGPAQPSVGGESLLEDIMRLSPKTDMQRSFQAQALSIAFSVGQTRYLMYGQSVSAVPVPLLVVLVLWLTVLFISFGLFAPSNATAVATLFMSALSISCAIFLIMEMYKPFEGLIQISSAPLRAVLANLGR